MVSLSFATSPSLPSGDKRSQPWGAWMVLAILVVTQGPLFVSMPIINDAIMYDMQVENIQRGGIQYRDILEPNLPGIVWIHWAVRSVLGWSSEALRIFDLTLFTTTIWLVSRWCRAAGLSLRQVSWTAVAVVLFYFSISEWNHCQRDTWMLVPALGALHLRRLQAIRLTILATSFGQAFRWSFAEGLCWGVAVWIKPHIALPGLACWVVSAIYVRRGKLLLADIAGLLCGGLVMGAAGIAWLVGTGAWPYFLDTFRNWNPRYFAARKGGWIAPRFAAMLYRYCPWFFVHVAAIPVAVWTLVRGIRGKSESINREQNNAIATSNTLVTCLLAAVYLVWFSQAIFLQHLFDYIYTPTIILALMVLACEITGPSWPRWRVAAGLFFGVALVCPQPFHREFYSPVVNPRRLSYWATCFNEGSTPRMRDELRLLVVPHWQQMERVAEFLEERGVKNGEICCFNDSLIQLYRRLNITPPTRYIYIEQLLIYFNDRRPVLGKALRESPQKYVVVDLLASGIREAEAVAPGKDGPNSPPPRLATHLPGLYPWSYPIIFRAGPYLVYEIKGEVKSFAWPAPMNPD